jgi:hypothetical protein
MQPKLCAALAFGFGATVLAVPFIHDPAEPNQLRGGLAGLVLGARLSEDANHTVLVLEAGGNGDDLRERIGALSSFPQAANPIQRLTRG